MRPMQTRLCFGGDRVIQLAGLVVELLQGGVNAVDAIRPNNVEKNLGHDRRLVKESG